jgi:hypothetical protein
MLAPGAIGTPKVTVPADSVLLNPPPLPCVGGVSNVNPVSGTVPPPQGCESVFELVEVTVCALFARILNARSDTYRGRETENLTWPMRPVQISA